MLLDGPKRAQQLENVKTIIRRLGQAGIPILGYNFSIAGVCGRTTAPYARGGAMSVGMEGPLDTPMPNGMVWNMVYDPHAPKGTVPAVTPRGTVAAPGSRFSTRSCRWRRKLVSSWRCTRTIRRCPRCAASRGWFINRTFTSA